MPANTAPLFALTPNVGTANITAANTNSNGSGTVGTDIFKAFTAGANGSWVSKVRLNQVATTAGTSTTGTVARIFYSTVGSSTTTGGTNTWLLAEVTIPSVAADSSSAPTNPIEVPLNVAIPSGGFIHVTNHAAPAASTSQQAVVFGGDY